ncbi:hypothetical protein VE00_02897 [Pseudogymnoascus sp. WSF 3629]|nr:hypothetical protein VE00_02897 [Pseudogymnoascus sp. WSF 3629]
MSVQHLATRLRITPQILESVIHALPRNDFTRQELNDFVEAIQKVQHRYLQGDYESLNVDTATSKNAEQGSSAEPNINHQSKLAPSEEGYWKKGEWAEKYKAILDRTTVPVENLRNYLGESLEQIDALILKTLPDIIAKRSLKRFGEDIRWMSAKYFGDPTDDKEFDRLVNRRETRSRGRIRKRERAQLKEKNKQNKTMGDAEAEAAEEVVERESEGDGTGEMPGTEIQQDDDGIQMYEEGAIHPHDHMSLQPSGSGQLFLISDDHLTKPLEPQTVMAPNISSEINTQAFTIRSNSSYLHDSVIGRPTSESPLQRRSEANHQSLSVGENTQTELAPTSLVSDRPLKELSDTIVNQNRAHQNDLQIRIKVEESPTQESVLNRIPQHLEFNQNAMASLEDYDHGLNHFLEVTCAEKRKRAELDTEDREAKFPKIAEEAGDIGKFCGQTDSDYEPAEADQIEELGPKIDTLERSPQLSFEDRVQMQSTGQNQPYSWLPYAESEPYIPMMDLRNSLELSEFGESNPPQQRKYLGPLMNERLPTESQSHPEEGEGFLGSPHSHMQSILDGDDTDTSRKSLAVSTAGSQIQMTRRRQRKIAWDERRKFLKQAKVLKRISKDLKSVSETTISTVADTPSQLIESLAVKAGNTAENQIMCSDGEVRPRGDEDEEMLVFVGWEQAAQSKLGNNGLFNPVQLYSKFFRSRIDDNRFGNIRMRSDQAAMLVYVIMGIGSPCAIAQFGKISTAMREELKVTMEFLPGHETYGRAALRLTLGSDEGPFKPFAESVLALEFYRFLENERTEHGEMLPLTARGFDFTKIRELEINLPPRRGRGANLQALQRIGYRLSKLTSIYGDGILALIPSSGCFGDCLNVLANMDEAAFNVFQQHMDKNRDQFLLKVSTSLEPYVREGMWDTLTLPKLRLEVEGGFDELVVRDRSDQLALMCSPSWVCIQLDRGHVFNRKNTLQPARYTTETGGV